MILCIVLKLLLTVCSHPTHLAFVAAKLNKRFQIYFNPEREELKELLQLSRKKNERELSIWYKHVRMYSPICTLFYLFFFVEVHNSSVYYWMKNKNYRRFFVSAFSTLFFTRYRHHRKNASTGNHTKISNARIVNWYFIFFFSLHPEHDKVIQQCSSLFAFIIETKYINARPIRQKDCK